MRLYYETNNRFHGFIGSGQMASDEVAVPHLSQPQLGSCVLKRLDRQRTDEWASRLNALQASDDLPAELHLSRLLRAYEWLG